MDDAEAQMRRALGLHGEGHRSRPDGDRPEPGQRMGGGGFTQGLHRRRFVQDGEVPVTVVRRDPAELPGGAPSGPSSSRLQRVEAALTAETAARDKADRALQETQAALQALRTKIGHHELERNEAVTTGRRDREESVSIREELAAARERLNDVEPRAEAAEAALRDLRSELNRERRARETAERRLENALAEPELALEAPPLHRETAAHAETPRVPARRGRPPNPRPEPVAEPEQEPVKWWLTPAKTAAKRR